MSSSGDARSAARPGSRRRARETALAALFSGEFCGPGPGGGADDAAGVLPDDPPRGYALRLIEGVRAHREEIDRRLGEASHHWRLERMSLIDRNILRIGAYEILFGVDVTPAVAINEAVEIARRYGDTDSWSFVNGVLDAVARGIPEVTP
jgi:N utilization substance protein B